MTHVAKVIDLVGSSDKKWKDGSTSSIKPKA